MKKILLICIGLFGLFICGCSAETDKKYAGILSEDRNNAGEPRIQVVSRTGYAGASVIIFLDTKTGREFLYYDHSIAEIKPKGER